jgi:hypothetical protein
MFVLYFAFILLKSPFFLIICSFKGLLYCFEGYVIAIFISCVAFMKCVSITRTVIGFKFLLAVDKATSRIAGDSPLGVRQR